MKQAAGFIIACPSTKRILLALRNDDAKVWAMFGGTLENQESPLQCAKRELLEECGFSEDLDYTVLSNRPVAITKYFTVNYRTYLAVSNFELVPKLNYEHIEYKWFKLDELPSDLHVAVREMLSDPKVIKKLEKIFE